jgi:hypothetical protein
LPAAQRTLAQYAGCLHRLDHEKKEGRIYDYAYALVPVPDRMHKRQLKRYQAIGYTVVAQNEKRDLFTGEEEDIIKSDERLGFEVPEMQRILRMKPIWKGKICKFIYSNNRINTMIFFNTHY